MHIKVNKHKLTDSPYNASRKTSFMFDDEEDVEQITLAIKHSAPTSFLISGYRGVGKTSFVNRVYEKLSPDYVCVNINLAKYDGYSTLIKKLIRELYLQYETYTEGKTQAEELIKLNKEFRLLYDRTFHDIVNSKIINSKIESKKSRELDIDPKKLLPFVLVLLSVTNTTFDILSSKWFGYLFAILSIVWACITALKINFSYSKNDSDTSELSTKSLYDDGIAEHHLLAIMQNLQQQKVKILVAFDELDKIKEPAEVSKVIDDLKFLLLSGFANFFVIAGQYLFYELEKSAFKENEVISSLFSKSVHISLLKYATLKKFCLDLLSDPSNQSDPVVNDLFNSLILNSGRIPRKLVNLIRGKLKWQGEECFLEVDINEDLDLTDDTRLLELLTKLMDGDLPDLASNPVQLDFFITQIFLWIAKMKRYTSGNFLMSQIVELNNYEGTFPDTYVAQLYTLGEMLTDRMADQSILKVHHGENEEQEISYSWLYQTNDLTPNEAIDIDQVETNSKLVIEFAELEGFLRKIYYEIVPAAVNGPRLVFTQLISQLVQTGILSKIFDYSPRVIQLVKTKNKIVHGEAVGPEDLAIIQSSSFGLRTLKLEIIDDYVFYLLKNYWSESEVSKQRETFDFYASRNDGVVFFEVKYYQSGKADTRNMKETVEKFNLYIATGNNSRFVLYIFLQRDTSIADNFKPKLEMMVKQNYPELENKIDVYYFYDSDDSLKIKIENSLDGIAKKLAADNNND